MSNVVGFGGATLLPLSVERVLTSDEAMALDEVLVIGWKPGGGFFFAGSESDMRSALMLLTLAQRWITDQYDLTEDRGGE